MGDAWCALTHSWVHDAAQRHMLTFVPSPAGCCVTVVHAPSAMLVQAVQKLLSDQGLYLEVEPTLVQTKLGQCLTTRPATFRSDLAKLKDRLKPVRAQICYSASQERVHSGSRPTWREDGTPLPEVLRGRWSHVAGGPTWRGALHGDTSYCPTWHYDGMTWPEVA